jgi:hypothetical protein
MDRTVITELLMQAERHIRIGMNLLQRQRELIDRMEQGKHDTTEAKALLARFEEVQALHIADRDRLSKELSESDQ